MTRYPRPERWLLLLMLLVALAGCSVSLIQPYDDVIEKTASDFYEDFLRFTISVRAVLYVELARKQGK
jgi:hypothetical protein